tara:strand:- start:4500 stop:4682 length:183 start_codon:yes stop_codon:yes gene_type:complete
MTEFFDKINLSNARSDDETFDQYKERLKKNQIKIKMHLKGEVIWDSKSLGTYIRKHHGNI